MQEFQCFIMDNVVKKVPHRHMVFCLPKFLRNTFLRNRESLIDLSRMAWETIKEFMQKTIGQKGVPGASLIIQTHGGLANVNPHIHAVTSDGLFTPSGNFYLMPRYTEGAKRYFQKLFEQKVIDYCLDKGYTKLDNIIRILNQRYTGFSVYIDTVIHFTQYSTDKEKKKLEQILRYVSKPFYSIERTTYIEGAKKVLYKGDYHPGLKRNFEYYSPTDFIAAVTAHIPNRYQQSSRNQQSLNVVIRRPGLYLLKRFRPSATLPIAFAGIEWKLIPFCVLTVDMS